MIGMWASFYFAVAIPKLETEPIPTMLHITVGTGTGVSLIIGGHGALQKSEMGLELTVNGNAIVHTYCESWLLCKERSLRVRWDIRHVHNYPNHLYCTSIPEAA